MRDEGAWLGTARTGGEKCVFSTDVCTGCWAGPRGEGPGCCDPPDCRPAEPQPSLWLGFDTVPDLVNSLFLKTLSGSFCRSHVEMAESDGDPSTALRAAARLPAPGSGQPARACAQGPPVGFPARGTPALLDPPLPACPYPACSHVHTHAAHKYTQTCAHMHMQTHSTNAHAPTCAHACTHTHVQTCTHTHTRTHPLPRCLPVATSPRCVARGGCRGEPRRRRLCTPGCFLRRGRLPGGVSRARCRHSPERSRVLDSSCWGTLSWGWGPAWGAVSCRLSSPRLPARGRPPPPAPPRLIPPWPPSCLAPPGRSTTGSLLQHAPQEPPRKGARGKLGRPHNAGSSGKTRPPSPQPAPSRSRGPGFSPVAGIAARALQKDGAVPSAQPEALTAVTVVSF